MSDLYEYMGVADNATPEDIRRAYRQRAKDMHPDKTGNADASEFCHLQNVYETLIDPVARQRYDGERYVRNTFFYFFQEIHVSLTLEQMFNGGTHVAGSNAYVIPPGVTEGLFAGNPNQPPLRITQKPHHTFTRIDDELYAIVQLTLKQALLGATQSMTGIDGHPLLFNTGTNPTKICIAEHGMPRLVGGRGALVLNFNVNFPTLTQEQKQELDAIL